MRNIKLLKMNVRIAVLASVVIAGTSIGTASVYRAQLTGRCASTPVASDTFIRTYRMRDRADGYGLLPTKDGGYLLMGDTVYSEGMSVWNAFVVKTDAKGAAVWSKQFDSQSAAQGVQTETKRLSAQTSDGNFVVAHDIIDFYDNENYTSKKELWGDVMVTKLNPSGNWMWSTMIGDYSMDFPQRLWATVDGGVILLAKLKVTGYEEEIADIDAVPEYSVVMKFDANGNEQWSKKMNWTATDMEYLPDGSFIALANISMPVTENADTGKDAAMGDIPTIIKLDGKLNVLWAKSIEAPPVGFNSVTGTTRETLKVSKTQIRLAGGDFRSVEQTPDGGFIAFGRYFNAAQLLGGNMNVRITSIKDPIPSVAVKVDAQGKYLWAKSVKTPFVSFDLDLRTVKTNDGEFVLTRNITRNAETLKMNDMAGNVEVMKVDADFNPRWIKKIDIERDAAVYDIRATSDNGVALLGRIITDEQHMVMGSLEPYEDTVLIKADANGNVLGATSLTASRQGTVADESSFLIMRNMSVGTEEVNVPIIQQVKPSVTNIEDKQRILTAHAKTNVTKNCSLLNTGRAAGRRSSRQGAVPQATTYPQIKFDSATEAKIETEKSRQVNAELLPILLKVFNNHVKMTDNTSGLWLTYFFPRQVTVADREAVQKAYVDLGYKVDEAEEGLLHVSKVGISLRMTFSVNNSMVGKLEVML